MLGTLYLKVMALKASEADECTVCQKYEDKKRNYCYSHFLIFMILKIFHYHIIADTKFSIFHYFDSEAVLAVIASRRESGTRWYSTAGVPGGRRACTGGDLAPDPQWHASRTCRSVCRQHTYHTACGHSGSGHVCV